MQTNLEKAKTLLQANANISGIVLPEDGFLFKMLELAATPDPEKPINVMSNPKSTETAYPSIDEMA